MANSILEDLEGKPGSILDALGHSSPENDDIKNAVVDLEEKERQRIARLIAESKKLNPVQALVVDAGATFHKAGQNIKRLFGDKEAEGKIAEIEANQDALRTGNPVATFGEPIVQGLSAISGMGIGGIGALAGKAAAGATLGGLEATAFSPSDVGDFSPVERATLGASVGLGAEMIGPALGAYKNIKSKGAKTVARKVDDLAKKLPTKAEAETGIELIEAQRGLNPAELETASYLGQLPEGSKQAMKRLGKQNKQVLASVSNVIESISKSSDNAAANIRSASKSAIDARKLAREELTSPIYKKAFKEAGNKLISTSDIVDSISMRAKTFPKGGKVNLLLKKVSGLIKDSNLEKLHNTKIEIDSLINGRGSDTVDSFAKSELLEIKENLLKRMEDASGTYKAARLEFAKASPAVDLLEEGTVGRIASLKDTQLKSASRILFDSAEGITNPAAMRNAKKAITDVAGGKQAWDSIVRSEIERRLSKMSNMVGNDGQMVENIPGMVRRALFKTDSKNILLAAVDDKTAKALEYLDNVLGKASMGRKVGSPTAARQKLIENARPFSRTRNIIKGLFSPADYVQEIGDEKALVKMADSIFTQDSADTILKIKSLKSRGLSYAKEIDKLTDIINSAEQYQSAGRAGVGAAIISSTKDGESRENDETN
jgi:hypothetical protein